MLRSVVPTEDEILIVSVEISLELILPFKYAIWSSDLKCLIVIVHGGEGKVEDEKPDDTIKEIRFWVFWGNYFNVL